MCSYCGCADTPVIGGYMEHHVDLVNLLGEVRRASMSSSDDELARAIDDLRAVLDPHTQSEERSLFIELRREPELADTVDALIEEHRQIEACVVRVAAREPGAYDELEHRLRRHIDKEDNGLFPAAVIALDGPSWERIVART